MVLRMLSLDEDFDYDIIQIGGSNDAKYEYASHDYLGKTNYHSLAYLIKNAELHLGFDSLPVHLASHFDRKIVAIYPWYAQNCGPYFSDADDIVILEPEFDMFKPCFNIADKFDLINTIEVSDIYEAVIDLMGK
jgi:ADP-heptose:LPS heptosyltransferase